MNKLNMRATAPDRRVPAFVPGVVDFALLNGAFFAVHHFKRGNVDLSTRYVKLLLAFYGICKGDVLKLLSL